MIILNAGHTISGVGRGAVGFFDESEHTRLITTKLAEALKKQGKSVSVVTCDKANTTTESLKYITDRVNKVSNAEIFVSIHFNAYDTKAHGVEVYTMNGKQHKEALKICENISSLGFYNRGVKNGSHLYVVKNTKPKALLIEICFCDNKKDADLYLKNIDNISKAIAESLTGEKMVTEDKEKCSLPEFEEARQFLMNNGITDGSRPKDNITREEVFALLYRTLNYEAKF